jgi:rhamnulokinase
LARVTQRQTLPRRRIAVGLWLKPPICSAVTVSSRFLAFDLGAESGRAVAAELDADRLAVREVRRFSNEPVRYNGALQWDILRLWQEMRGALDDTTGIRFESIGLDAWGCDFALLGEQGNLLENPYHYRDARTDGVMQAVVARVPAERIYATTGVQFLPFNTLYQLYAACQQTPRLIDAAASLATIPDLLNYWLTGQLRSEFTIASTTQFVNARSRAWAMDLLCELDLPGHLLAPMVEPGTRIGALGANLSRAHAGTPVVAPACHDTGSAVAAVHAGGRTAFLSSGTWSLLGTELAAPIVTERARQLNFTNEGGVCGTTRLLKNIAGLWLLQSCRRAWKADGVAYSYDELIAAAADERCAFAALFDPDHPEFLHPENMVTAIAAYCRITGQPEPANPPAYVRAILESLAFKYRVVIEALEALTGTAFEEIRVVGGGARNRLLNQFTADATGRRVVAGPIEATALGNIAMQMLATGAVRSLDEARAIIDRAFPPESYEPADADRWSEHYQRFQDYAELTCA